MYPRRALAAFMAWVDFILAGPPRPPAGCQPARLTYYSSRQLRARPRRRREHH